MEERQANCFFDIRHARLTVIDIFAMPNANYFDDKI